MFLATVNADTLWLWAGWTMIHFIWVGALLGLGALACRLALGRAGPSVRYTISLAWLVVIAIAPAAVAVRTYPAADPARPVPRVVPLSLASEPEHPTDLDLPGTSVIHGAEPQRVNDPDRDAAVTRNPASWSPHPLVTALPWLWVVGAPLTFTWSILGLAGAERLRNLSNPVTDPTLSALFQRLLDSTRIPRTVALLLCERVASPVVVGILRPAILLPPALASGLSAQQLEMLLLHELAHVRRWDNLVNLLQRLLEALLFFQPAVWLVSRWVREEREHCCDDSALRRARAASPDTYADALLAVVRLAGRERLGPSLAISAGATRSHLALRLHRILGREEPMQVSRSLVVGAAVTVIAAVVSVGAVATSLAQADARRRAAGEAPASDAKPNSPVVLTVGTEPGARYKTIQSAVDAAPDGATIQISAGTYDGDVVIRKPLTLFGAGWDKTTLVALQPTADQLAQAQRRFEQSVQGYGQAGREHVRMMMDDFRRRLLRPAVRIDAAQGVTLRDLGIVAQPISTENGIARSPAVLLLIERARAEVDRCAVVGSPGDAVHILNGADVTVRRSLVAAAWGEGIVVGEREGAKSRATLSDCDVRNVYHYGILVGRGHDATIERCRISGTAWHGIRYDDASPTITGNHVFANARSGIYASGRTAATITNNRFANNEMDAISCWFFNADTVSGNTFTKNLRSGIDVLGESTPTIDGNLFVDEQVGVACGSINGNAPGSGAVGHPVLRNNVFSRCAATVQLTGWDKARPRPDWVKLDEAAGNKVADVPIGAAGHLAWTTDSPFPLQPQEKAIIPDGDRHDYNLWKRPALEPLRPAAPPDLAAPPAAAATEKVSYEQALADLHQVLGREYPCFKLKGIDWAVVGKELLPRAKQVNDDKQFGLLCMELVAKLEDSHALVGPGSVQVPTPEFPQWDPGFACLLDDRGQPVVYYVDPGSPADKAGLKPGTTILSVDGKSADDVMTQRMKDLSRYAGYSSDRYLRYHAAQFLPRVMRQGQEVELKVQDAGGAQRELTLPATLRVRYLPRLPVPIKGIQDSANVSWTLLDDATGYIYVRRIGNDLVDQLDRAVGALKDAKGLIIDVRGNSGGGFDADRSFRNFDPDDKEEPARPRFAGPIAVLIDSRCISAAEGWASWFVAQKRARLFGEATAGASSRKRQYTLTNGLYTVTFPVKAYTGFLDRPIERKGLEPDEPVKQNAKDLAEGRDTVLEAAHKFLVGPK
jgi:parallel beta-helix repeat protein